MLSKYVKYHINEHASLKLDMCKSTISFGFDFSAVHPLVKKKSRHIK